MNDYQQSSTIKMVRQDFLDNRWPRGCERCQIEEENGIKSKRQLDYDRWEEYYQQYDIDRSGLLTASIAFGNTCNLTCITCGPYSSSRWQSEHLQIYHQDILPNHFYKNGFVKELITVSANVIHLDIPGGEPFLSGVKQQQELLQALIEQGRANQITLHYTTNITVWPEQRWWDLWSHFKEIDMQLSLDGIGHRFEYIRYPANWNIVQKNIIKYQNEQNRRSNFKISVSHTVSAYNIYYLPEFFDWCVNQGLPRPWLGRLHTPVHMRASVWPKEAKRYIIQNLQSSVEDCQIWADFIASTDDSKFFDVFLERLEQHDRYRGLNFSQTFPEMSSWV